MATVPHSVGLDAALTMLLGGSKVPAGGLQPPVAGQQQHVAPFSVPVQPAASEELITPVNAEANPAAALLLGAGAVAALPPPPPARCLLCNGVGSSGACGPLRPVTVEGQQAMVHDQCAVWSPGCYLPEGSSTYVNLEAEYRRARHRICSACGQGGAAVPCSHPWCRCAYHLPCALGAPGVLLEGDTFEAWCPLHADGEGSDEDYTAAAPARPRRQPGSSTGAAKRPRASTEAQRPRTDWQKKDEHTWLKVVPPWWCEQRTVHFATKVYKELFRSAGSAVLVDPQGGQWLCLVQTEARNDNRPQYTLRGAFAELWEAQGIASGDTLIFRRDPMTGHIELGRHASGSGTTAGARMEEAASELSELSGGEGSGGRPTQRRARQEASSDRGTSQQGAHPRYAGTHGTPAIHAALAAAGGGGGGAAAAAAALTAALPAPKRQRTGDDAADAAAALLADTEAAVLAARRAGAGVAGPSYAAPFSLADWQPSAPHVQMFTAITGILAGHHWSEAEQAEVLRFRAKYAWLDTCGREVAYLTCSQLRSDRAALLEFVRAAGQGILTAAPSQGHQGVQFQPAGAGARVSPFAAAATPGGAAALGEAGMQLAGPTASSPAPPAQQQQEQKQEQQREEEQVGGVSIGGMPNIASLLEMHNTGTDEAMQVLEGAASFNLDAAYFTSHAAPATAVKAEEEEVHAGHVPTPH